MDLPVYPQPNAEKASHGIISPFSVERAAHDGVLKDKEIRGIIDSSAELVKMTPEKQSIMHTSLDFDSRMVEQLMIPRNEVDLAYFDGERVQSRAILLERGRSRCPFVSERSEVPVGDVMLKNICDGLSENRGDRTGILQCVGEKFFSDLKPSQSVNCSEPCTKIDLTWLIWWINIATSQAWQLCIRTGCRDKSVTPRIHSMLKNWIHQRSELLKTGELTALPDSERALNMQFPSGPAANTITSPLRARPGRMPESGDEIEQQGSRFLTHNVKNHRVQISSQSVSGQSGLSDVSAYRE